MERDTYDPYESPKTREKRLRKTAYKVGLILLPPLPQQGQTDGRGFKLEGFVGDSNYDPDNVPKNDNMTLDQVECWLTDLQPPED